MCRGENQGVITYTDGRVAVIANPDADREFFIEPPPGDLDRSPIRLDVSPEVKLRMRQLQGVEFGDGSATGAFSSIPSLGFLQTMYQGSPVTWSPEHLRELYRILGQTSGQSANAFICSDLANAGRYAVNNDAAHRASVLAAIDTLAAETYAGSLDEVHRCAMLASLRAAVGLYVSEVERPQKKKNPTSN